MSSSGGKVGFRWANLSATQQASINSNSGIGADVVNYVRGDKSNESAGRFFRPRVSVMGAVIHSRAMFVDHATAPTVYVGANDGMLHAINESTGAERWAYVPRAAIANVNKLSANPFAFSYFVDGGLNWRTIGSSKILAGTMGAGGRAVFSLDITNPAATSESSAANQIKWEVDNTMTGYANLGYSHSEPLMVKLNNGQDAVIVGNGYGAGTSSLFIINATDGSLIREINVGTTGGLSTPTGYDVDFNRTVDTVYAGDLNGKLWKFNLSATSAGSWTATELFATNPLQPITTAPTISAHPDVGVMVSFVTGKMLNAADLTNAEVHYAYGIWDGPYPGNTALVTQTLAERTYSGGVKVRVATTDNQPLWTSGGSKGWKVPLPKAGERATGDRMFTRDGRLNFTAMNPTVTGATGYDPDGEGWAMQLDALTGGGSAAPILDLNNDGNVNDQDRVSGSGVATVPIGRFLGAGIFSQPIRISQSSSFATLVGRNDDIVFPPPPTASTDRGVSGGHFDADIYYTLSGRSKNLHVHEYDDKYNVTGVNMLNASNAGFNLANAITSTSTPFKILIANQKLNPAAGLRIGTAAAGTPEYPRVWTMQTTAGLDVATLPTYTRATIGKLTFNLPLDAFASKEWWSGTGDIRAGLMPTATGCVHAGTPGPLGEIYNGALTIQIVSDTTANSDIELNVAGQPAYGYRLKSASRATQRLAEFTYFWHHPNGKCATTSGWTQTPPLDNSANNGNGRPPATGSSDPRDGSFTGTDSGPSSGGSGGGGSNVQSVTTSTSGNTTTIVIRYTDGTTTTEVRTANADGSFSVQINGGTPFIIKDDIVVALRPPRQRTGRVAWHELIKR